LNKELEPTNQRNQTLKDLLAQVGHYSVTTRREALVGLKDLFQCHENLLQENLGIVIKRVAEKMTDSEPSVRQSLLLFLCFIFPMVPEERMAPFSSLIVAHLSCAMTHIYDDIQHDSLGFLELCLRYFPNLMVTSSSQLIQNFVGMISHQSAAGVKKSTGLQLKAGKGLSVNPKGKLSSLRSRLKVLQQLLAFLKALESSSKPCQGEDTFSSMNNLVASAAKPAFHFKKLLPTQVQVLQRSVDEPKLIPFMFDKNSPSANRDAKSNILTDEQQARDFMKIIVPLLLECWIECNPAQMTTGLPDSVMSSSATDVMLAIAEILKVIFKAAERNQRKNCNSYEQTSEVNSLREVYFKDLNQHLMSYFPFTASHITSLKKAKRKLGKSPQPPEEEKNSASVLTLNLTICEIMLQFVSNDASSQRNIHHSYEKLEEFVVESLELKAKGGIKAQLLQTEHVESLVSFAYKIIVYRCSCAQQAQDPSMIKELLDAAFNLYQSSHIMSATKRVLMIFFANLVFSENPNMSRHGILERWLQGLPSLLVQLKDKSPAMTELVLSILKKAVMQSILKPDDYLLSHMALFFSGNNGPFGNLSEAIQRSAVELLFHLPSMDNNLLQTVVSCCQDCQVNISVIQYILQVLHYRSPCCQGFLSLPAAFSLPIYLSTLFSMAIGFSRHQLTDYQDAAKHETIRKLAKFKECNFFILEGTAEAEQSSVESSRRQKIGGLKFWEDHQTKLQAVCQCYRQCNQSELLLQYMGSALESFMEDFKVLPLTAAHSLLSVIKCLVELATNSESTVSSRLPALVLSNLAQLSLVCLQHCTTLESCTEDSTSSTSAVKKHLFDAVVELLLVSPTILPDMLSLLLKILSDNLESVKQDCAAILTKVFSCELRKILLQSGHVVQLIVSCVLCAENPSLLQKQCFADLQYQFSLFKIEAGLS